MIALKEIKNAKKLFTRPYPILCELNTIKTLNFNCIKISI